MASTDSAAATPTATPAPTPRYVPGAPPPAPPSKSKKKKAKSALKNLAAAAHEAALSDHAPDVEDVKAGKVDPSLLANPPPPSSGGQDTGNNTDADEAKAPEDKSVVAESIAKRVRALGKKAQRLQEYKNQKEELNPDQKAALEGLPLLESNIKELEGIKKTVETLEAGQRRALAQQRNEERKAAERRVTEATQHAEASLLPRITSLLSFLALRNLLTHATPSDISISDAERNAIISAGDALLAHPPVGHVEEIVKGFLTGAGSWEDIEYSRLLEITSQFAAPRAATPIPDPSVPLDPTTTTHPEAEPEEEEPEPEAEPEVEPEAEVEQPEEAPEVEQPVVLGFNQPPATSGGFHFMQESELDVPATMTESQEWVSVQQHEGAQEEEEEEVAPEEDVGYVGTEEGATLGADAAGGAPLDWAAAGDEHDELPDIGGLQATFGGSGSATPIAPQVTSTGAPTTGKSVTIDDDGFTAIPTRRGGHGQRGSYGGRGRGGPRGEGFRGRGGFRGEGGEGGYRGRGRGGWQGGEGGEGGEGGYRGRGGYRGGEGGEGGYRGRGGYRGEGGEGEGGYRGRGRGWQGGEGGEGGEGGYRGRGGYRSGEGGEGGYRGRGGYRSEGGEGGEGGYRGRGRGSWGGEGGEGRGGRGGYRGERRGGSGFRGGRGGSGGATPTAEAPGAA